MVKQRAKAKRPTITDLCKENETLRDEIFTLQGKFRDLVGKYNGRSTKVAWSFLVLGVFLGLMAAAAYLAVQQG